MRLLTDSDGIAPESTAAWNASRRGMHSSVPVKTSRGECFGAVQESPQAGPHLVVAIYHHNRNRRVDRGPHQRGLLGREAAPCGVLQPEVPDLHQHVAPLVDRGLQRRLEHAVAVVDVAQQQHPLDDIVAHSGVVVPGALGSELKMLKELIVPR